MKISKSIVGWGLLALLGACAAPAGTDDAQVAAAVRGGATMTTGDAHADAPVCGTLGDALGDDGVYDYCVNRTSKDVRFVLADGQTLESHMMEGCTIDLAWRSDRAGRAWRTRRSLDCFAVPEVLTPEDLEILGVAGEATVTGVHDLVLSLALEGAPTSGLASAPPPAGVTPKRALLTPAQNGPRRVFDILAPDCADELARFLDKLGGELVLQQRLTAARRANDRALVTRLEADLARIHADAETSACRLLRCVTGTSETLRQVVEIVAQRLDFPLPTCNGNGQPANPNPPPPLPPLPPNGGLQVVPAPAPEAPNDMAVPR